MMSEDNSELSPGNVDLFCFPHIFVVLMNITNHLKTGPLGNQLILLPKNVNVCLDFLSGKNGILRKQN